MKFPSDLANFESKSNENSLRQPPRFCNAKKPLLISFKMPYSKPKSEQKWRFKLNEKTGDQIPTFTIEKRTYVGGLLLQFKPSFLLGFWLGIWHFKELKQTFLGITEPSRLSKWIFVQLASFCYEFLTVISCFRQRRSRKSWQRSREEAWSGKKTKDVQ